MTTLVLMIWFAVLTVITLTGFALVMIFAYGGALWRSLKRQGKAPRPSNLGVRNADRGFEEPTYQRLWKYGQERGSAQRAQDEENDQCRKLRAKF